MEKDLQRTQTRVGNTGRCCRLRGLADVASWTVSDGLWRESGAVGNGWVHHQSSVSSGSSSPPSAKVSTLAATDCPALGAASSAPPQLPSSMLRALWTAGRSDSDLRLSRSCLRIASEPLTHSTGHGMTITRIGDYGPITLFYSLPYVCMFITVGPMKKL